MYLFKKFNGYMTGEYCPESGLWQTIYPEKTKIVSKGQRFPGIDGQRVKWKLKEAYEPDPAILQTLMVAN